MKDGINWEKLIMQLPPITEIVSSIADIKVDLSCFLPRLTEEISFNTEPLARIPFEVRKDITTSFYEPGSTSMAQKFIEKHLISWKDSDYLQKLLNDLYHYALRRNSHILANNVIVILSQLPYRYLGSWADMLAVAATRSSFLDVQELGIRCFENWENKDSCTFLNNCHFEERWLQEYADEVYNYVMEEGHEHVLLKKDISWPLAVRESNCSSNIERYTSGYSSSGIPN